MRAPTIATPANVRSQAEIVADLLDRADKFETSARTNHHTKANKHALLLVARAMRVAALQNSVGYTDDRDSDSLGSDD